MPGLRRAVAVLLLSAAGCSPAAEPAQSSSSALPGPPEPASVQPTSSAIALYERRTAADPRDHLSPALLAELHLRRAAETGDPACFTAAERAARTSLERSARHPPAVASLAHALGATGRADEASRLVFDVLDDQPRSVPLLCAAFDLAAAADDWARADVFAERLLALNEEPATLCRLAQVAARAGRTDHAVALLRRAANDADELGGLPAELAEYRRRAGEILLAAARHDEAGAEFDAAIAVNPRDASAWSGRAEVLRHRGDTAGATAATETSRSIRPGAAAAPRDDRVAEPAKERR